MYRTATQKDNKNLLKYLNTYQEYITNKSLDMDDKLGIDALFSEAFYNMYEMAERRHNEDLLQALEEYYPPVEHIVDTGDIL